MRSILSWPLGQYGPLLGYPSLFNPYTKELVENLTGWMNRGVCSIGSYPPEIEEVLAKRLIDLYEPHMTSSQLSVRFFSNGTDATQAAVALARHRTGRDKIISIGYHGGSSPVFNTHPQSGGVLHANHDATINIDFFDYSTRRRYDNFADVLNQCAALVVEIPPAENEDDIQVILNLILRDCNINRVQLIMDEIVTGFRYSPAGALGYYKRFAYADYVCLGKALSTYGKVSALIGPNVSMDTLAKDVFASYTFNDHPLGFMDAMQTFDMYEKLGAELYQHIDQIGNDLKYGLNKIFVQRGFEAKVIGHPSRTAIQSEMDTVIYWTFLSKLVDEHDILIHRPQFACMSHTNEDVDRTIKSADKVLAEMGFELQ